jgi:signal transduction histidine kinase
MSGATGSTRVLLVEDAEEDAQLIERLFARAEGAPFEVERRELVREALEHLESEPVDVVLLDLGLPDATALSGLDRVLAAAPTVPVIVLTGADHADLAEQALQRGAEDFVVKHRLDGDGLARSVRYAIERKRAEEALHRTHEQLRTSQKMEAIGRLAGGLAHDFNGVLTAILGYADLLIDQTPPDDPRRSDIEEIRRAGERAAALTHQVLAFSRHQVVEPKVLVLNSVVGDLSKMLVRLISAQIDLRLDLAPDLGSVLADPSQIEQVVMNLVLNARDAMPAGGSLVLRTANVVLGGDGPTAAGRGATGEHVLLEVADTGTGMTPETMAHIFEPFFTTKDAGKGTGLGLATVYGIVHRSGGFIEADSEPGEGSVFRVYLPRVRELPAIEPVEPEREAPPSGHETVLVTDDDEGVRALTRRVLERCGYRVLEAASAEEAMLLATRHDGPIHLLLTDVVLPHMNGRDLAERVRKLRPEVRVLFSSGYGGLGTPPLGLDLLRSAYLEKPYRPAALAREVRAALEARSRR